MSQNIAHDDFPAAIDAERAILGACIEDSGILHAVLAEGLSARDFSVSDHRALWELILEMCDKAEPVSLISLAQYLPKAALPAIADLAFGVVLAQPHILHFVRIVRQKAKLRYLLHLSEWISTEAVAVGADPITVVTRLKKEISELECRE